MRRLADVVSMAGMNDERQGFRTTHLATGVNRFTGPSFSSLPVLVQGDHAFTESEWKSHRDANIVRDQSRDLWCHGGDYQPVAMVPVP